MEWTPPSGRFDIGLPVGGVHSIGYGMTILEGLVAGAPREVILGGLTRHVAEKIKVLDDALNFTLGD